MAVPDYRDYREKLRQAELKDLQNELIEKDNRIRKLEENNDALAKIIHKDNKMIPAMELAVCEYLETEATDDDTRKKGEQLASGLKTMAQDRKGTLNSYRHDEHALPVTGVCVLDALLPICSSVPWRRTSTFPCISQAIL